MPNKYSPGTTLLLPESMQVYAMSELSLNIFMLAGIFDPIKPLNPTARFGFELGSGNAMWAGNVFDLRHKLRLTRHAGIEVQCFFSHCDYLASFNLDLSTRRLLGRAATKVVQSSPFPKTQKCCSTCSGISNITLYLNNISVFHGKDPRLHRYHSKAVVKCCSMQLYRGLGRLIPTGWHYWWCPRLLFSWGHAILEQTA